MKGTETFELYPFLVVVKLNVTLVTVGRYNGEGREEELWRWYGKVAPTAQTHFGNKRGAAQMVGETTRVKIRRREPSD